MSFFDFSVGQAKLALDALEAILKKAQSAPNAAELPLAKIHDDMLPLAFQVNVATDISNKIVARLLGEEPPAYKWEDLKTFDDFFARINTVKAILDKATKDTINASQEKTVPLGVGPGKPALQVSGYAYVTAYGLPNVYFHVVTAYNILRKEGIPLGKMDYLGPYMGPYMPKSE